MSWRASGYVKGLDTAPNGERLSRSEKLLLLCLADDFNESQGYAWPSIKTLSKAVMLSSRRTQELLRKLEQKGMVTVESVTRTDGGSGSNHYRFPGLQGEGAEIAEGASGRTRGREAVGDTHIYEQGSNERTKRATSLSSNFTLTTKLKQSALKIKPNADVEFLFDEFTDYCKSKGSKYKDWEAAFRGWVRRSITFDNQRQQPARKPATSTAIPVIRGSQIDDLMRNQGH